MEQINLLKTDYGLPENPAHVDMFSLKPNVFSRNAQPKRRLCWRSQVASSNASEFFTVNCPGLGSAKSGEEETHARGGHIKYTPNISRSMKPI